MYDLVLHLLLFAIAGSAIVFLPLLVGRLVRPTRPTPEKEAIYECGEPTIGSSYVQFDLRFYTVALLFIVFDVEVAFFFPWATMYGNTMQLADPELDPGARVELSSRLLNSPVAVDPIPYETATQLGWLAFADIFVFFAVLMVGFAYIWKRGDLEWVRSLANTPGNR